MTQQTSVLGVILGADRRSLHNPLIHAASCDSCTSTVINGTAVHEAGCTGHMLYMGHRGRIYRKVRVWGLDVWGSSYHGFTVNDRYVAGHMLVPSDMEDSQLVRALKTYEFIGKRTWPTSYVFDGDEKTVHVTWKKTGCPMYQLEVM